MTRATSRDAARYALCLALAAAGCGGNTTVLPSPDAAPVDAAATTDAAPADVAAAPDVANADASAPADAPTAADAAEPPVESSPCDALRAGTVSGFMVDGREREFILALPPGAEPRGERRWPVVFAWHGLGDTARNFHGLLSGQVGNATMPFILVTPEDSGLGPTTTPPGLDWDELRVDGPNREARLFDAVLRCLDERWGVDRERVYTAGFSAGAIMSDLLAVLRGDQLAAVATYSGAYFSNPENPATLGLLRSFVSWPALSTRNPYPQLLVSGGMTDSVSVVVTQARFDVFARNDGPYLRAAGHATVVCDHGMGHRVPQALSARQLVAFFAAHPRNVGRSPWATALPNDYPDYCSFQAAEAR